MGGTTGTHDCPPVITLLMYTVGLPHPGGMAQKKAAESGNFQPVGEMILEVQMKMRVNGDEEGNGREGGGSRPNCRAIVLGSQWLGLRGREEGPTGKEAGVSLTGLWKADSQHGWKHRTWACSLDLGVEMVGRRCPGAAEQSGPQSTWEEENSDSHSKRKAVPVAGVGRGLGASIPDFHGCLESQCREKETDQAPTLAKGKQTPVSEKPREQMLQLAPAPAPLPSLHQSVPHRRWV